MTKRCLAGQLCVLFLFAQSVNAQEVPLYIATHYDAPSTGYYFLCPIQVGPNPRIPPMLLILDGSGKVVYYRILQGAGAGDFKTHPNGMMSFYHQGMFYMMDSAFAVVDSVTTVNGLRLDTHDFLILPNGHFLLTGFEDIRMDLSAYRMFNRRGSPGDSNAVVECGVIQELDRDRNVVFEWHAKDHYAFDDVDAFFLTDSVDVDWTHFNAVELDNDGNIMVSPRFFNEITKIDRTTGAIIWRLGGRRNQFAFTNDTAAFLAQHDIRRIANGNITLFDNGRNGAPVHPAGGKEYRLDETARTATLVWSYIENPLSFSRAIGNTQRLADGNTLVNYGLTDRENLLFNVVTPSGEKVFELAFADTLRSYRVFHYASLPWRLDRPRITCFDSAGLHYLDAGPGHLRYLWSTGDTTRVIPAIMADTIVVHVPRGAGMIASEEFIVGGPDDPCGVASLPPMHRRGAMSILPNPVIDMMLLHLPSTGPDGDLVEVADLMGRVLRSFPRTSASRLVQVDVRDLSGGIYLVRIGEMVEMFVKW